MNILKLACKTGDLETVIKLSHLGEMQGVNLFYGGPGGVAVKYGNNSIVEYLIRTERLFMDGYFDRNILCEAVKHGNYSMVLYMTAKLCKLYLNSVLLSAARNNHLPLVKYAISNGASMGCIHRSIAIASDNGHVEVVRYLANNGANVDMWEDYPLRIASVKGNLFLVKYLVEHGANINNSREVGHMRGIVFHGGRNGQNGQNGYYKNAYKECALVLALLNGHLPVVQYLLEHGADVTTIKENHIKFVSQHNYKPIIKLLVKYKT